MAAPYSTPELAKAHIEKLARRIRNQRRSLRENWEIVETRRKWIPTSDVMRDRHYRYRDENKLLRSMLAAAHGEAPY